MKVQNLLGGLILTGAVVGAGSVGLGSLNRKIKHEKSEQVMLENKMKSTGISTADFAKIQQKAQNMQIPHDVNKVYQEALDSLELKAWYEKVQLQTIDSLKKVIVQKDDSIKMLRKATRYN